MSLLDREKVQTVAILWLVLAGFGCNNTAQPPTGPTPTAVPPAHTLSGVIIDQMSDGTRAVADARVSLSLTTTEYGPSPFFVSRKFHYWQTTTDSAGRYRFGDLPTGDFVLWAGFGDYVQPCAAFGNLNTDKTFDVAVLSKGSFERNPVHLPSGSPTISGTVFETTGERRQPLASVDIYFSIPKANDEELLATTRTDTEGRYLLCRLPLGVNYVAAFKPGYQGIEYQYRVEVRRDVALDLEMKRQ